MKIRDEGLSKLQLVSVDNSATSTLVFVSGDFKGCTLEFGYLDNTQSFQMYPGKELFIGGSLHLSHKPGEDLYVNATDVAPDVVLSILAGQT